MVGLGIPFMANVGWINGEDNWCPLWNHYQIFKASFDFFFIEFFVVHTIYMKSSNMEDGITQLPLGMNSSYIWSKLI